MQKGYSKYLKLIVLLGDLILLNLISIISTYCKFLSIDFIFDIRGFFIMSYVNIAWIVLVYTGEVYTIKRIVYAEKVMGRLIKTALYHLIFVFALLYIINEYTISIKQLTINQTTVFVSIFLWRLLFVKLLKKYRTMGLNFREVVIIGAGAMGNKIYDNITENISLGYKFVGFFDDNPRKCRYKNKILGSVEDFKKYHEKNGIDEVYITLPEYAGSKISEIISYCESHLIRCKIIPDFNKYVFKNISVDYLNNIPVLTLRQEPLEKLHNRILKRTFDIVFSLIVIICILSWIFPIIALLIKISSPGPIFFKQKRSGRDNEPFNCYKFRSMAVNKESDKLQAKKNDPRITTIGKILRKTNIDELPQFFNVLIGNMSIVGPRPHMLKHTEEYSNVISKYLVRQLIKPGITGFAQVKGYRGETKTVRMMYKRVQLDIWYIEHWSFLLDIKIIYLTVYNMFRGEENAG